MPKTLNDKLGYEKSNNEDVPYSEKGEELLRSSLFFKIVEQNPSPLVLTDKQWRVLYANEAVFETNEDVSEDTVSFFDMRVLNDSIREAMNNTLADGKTWQKLIKNRKKYGAVDWTEIKISPVKDDFGAVGYYVIQKNDVNEKVKKQREFFLLSEKLDMLVENIPMALFEINLNYKILRNNPAAQEIFGLSDP